MFTNLSDSLCNSHNSILYWVREVKKSLKKEVKKNPDLESNLDPVFSVLDKISCESRIAKRKGQHMENRLKKYRNSIESLGFERVGM